MFYLKMLIRFAFNATAKTIKQYISLIDSGNRLLIYYIYYLWVKLVKGLPLQVDGIAPPFPDHVMSSLSGKSSPASLMHHYGNAI